MPRRYLDYADNFYGWNSLATFGSLVTIMSLVVFALNGSALNPSSYKPTMAPTIEWVLSPTPASHLFKDLPVIRTTS